MYARIQKKANKALVRFEQVTPKTKFDLIRDYFYQEFPDAYWDDQIRWMVLPDHEYPRLVKFAHTVFGTGSTHIV